MAGQTIGNPAIRQQTGVIILALKPVKEPMRFNPSPDTVVRAGDCLIVIADDVGLKKLEALAHPRKI